MKRLLGIIIEGCDCSGKSTLVNHLKIRLSSHGWDTFSIRHKKVKSQFDRYLFHYLNNDSVLYDRSHFSEIVLSKFWRKDTGFNAHEKKFINEFVLNNFIVVLVEATETDLVKRYNKKKEQAVMVNEIIDIQNLFKKELNHPQVLNYRSINFDELHKISEKIYKKIKLHHPLKMQIKDVCNQTRNKKFILLEGSNASGKSTLAKLLKINMVGWSIKTLDYKKTSDNFIRYFKEYVNNNEIIFDRGHISEIVYGNIFRQGNHFDKDEIYQLNEYLKKNGILIFCNPSIEVVKSRLKKVTYPKHIHESRIEQVIDEFKKIIYRSEIPYIEIDNTNKSLNKAINEVKKYINASTYIDMKWDKPLV